jgi:putative DNA primase/helicase
MSAATEFLDFCRLHGLHVRHVTDDGKVHRVPTDAKPQKRNGAFSFNGEFGWCQDWTTMDRPAVFRCSEPLPKRDAAELRRKMELDRRDMQRRQAEAAQEAARMFSIAETITGHPYLVRKGFPDQPGRALDGQLLIPMRLGKNLVSLQRITGDGEKKFLSGGIAKAAHLVMGHTGAQRALWFCEGFATALSLKAALARLSRRHDAIVICFSAGNIPIVASMFDGKRIIAADNDQSKAGEAAAIKTGLPWVMPPSIGDDFNDMHQKEGLYAVCDLIRSI